MQPSAQSLLRIAGGRYGVGSPSRTFRVTADDLPSLRRSHLKGVGREQRRALEDGSTDRSKRRLIWIADPLPPSRQASASDRAQSSGSILPSRRP